MLSAPLRDRFGVVSHMEYYTVEELRTIIMQSAQVLDVEIDEKALTSLLAVPGELPVWQTVCSSGCVILPR